MRSEAYRQTFSQSASLRPTGRQMRVWQCRYFDSGADTTPSSTLASISTWGSPSVAAPAIGPTYNAECDHVDWVRYLIPPEIRPLPSTSKTSPGRRVSRSAVESLRMDDSQWLVCFCHRAIKRPTLSNIRSMTRPSPFGVFLCGCARQLSCCSDTQVHS